MQTLDLAVIPKQDTSQSEFALPIMNSRYLYSLELIPANYSKYCFAIFER